MSRKNYNKLPTDDEETNQMNNNHGFLNYHHTSTSGAAPAQTPMSQVTLEMTLSSMTTTPSSEDWADYYEFCENQKGVWGEDN